MSRATLPKLEPLYRAGISDEEAFRAWVESGVGQHNIRASFMAGAAHARAIVAQRLRRRQFPLEPEAK